jgi:cytochrome c-type biogenesis protein CcmH
MVKAKRHHWLYALLLAVAMHGAYAKEAAPASDDPALEKRVMSVAEELRCLVCQNQTVADSHADLAADLRNEIREKMKAGATEQDIIKYMVARYGDFVLYKPPLKATTLLLWFGPLLLMLVGLYWLVRRVSAGRAAALPPLSDDERRRAAALLAGGEGAQR